MKQSVVFILLFLTLQLSALPNEHWEISQYIHASLPVDLNYEYEDAQGNKWYQPRGDTLYKFTQVDDSVIVKSLDLASFFDYPTKWVSVREYISDTLFLFYGRPDPDGGTNKLIWYNPVSEEVVQTLQYPDSMPPIDFFSSINIAPDSSYWIETWDRGVVHYDHGEWKLWDSSNSTLYMNYVKELNFRNDGSVWMTWNSSAGGKGAVSVYNNGEWEYYNKDNSVLPSNCISDIEFLDNGDIWMALGCDDGGPLIVGGGVVQIQDTNWTSFDPTVLFGAEYPNTQSVYLNENSLPSFAANGMERSYDNGTWISSEYPPRYPEGILLDSVDDDVDRTYTDTSSSNVWYKMVVDVVDEAGAKVEKDDGYKYYNAETGAVTHFKEDSIGMPINSAYISGIRQDSVWFECRNSYYKATGEILLYDLKSQKFTYMNGAYSVISDSVNSVTVSPDGVKYFFTSAGLSTLDNEKKWGAKLQTEFIYTPSAIAWHSDGTLFLATDGTSEKEGIQIIKGDSLKIITSDSGLVSTEIHDIELYEEQIWVASRNHISRFDGTDWLHWNTSTLFDGVTYARALAIENDSSIWLATSSGAAYYDGKKWSIFNTGNSDIPANYLSDVVIDDSGTIWFSTLNSGVVSYSNSIWTSYNTESSILPSNDIRKIYSDPYNNIWALGNSLYGFGAAKFNGVEWRVYTSDNSDLPSNKITAVAFDKDGSKWFSTKAHGVAHLIDDQIPVNSSVISVADLRSGMKVLGDNLQLTLAGRSAVKLNIYDLRGRLLVHRNLGELDAGVHEISPGKDLARGCYIARITAGDLVQSVRVVR